MEPTKVYVVTDGSYSDYHICGIFSTKEAASAFQNSCGYDGMEEFTLDELKGHEKRSCYQCTIDLQTGEVLDTDSTSEVASLDERGSANIYDYRSGDKIARSISYVSPEHARKLAIEKRQEWLRTGGNS